MLADASLVTLHWGQRPLLAVSNVKALACYKNCHECDGYQSERCVMMNTTQWAPLYVTNVPSICLLLFRGRRRDLLGECHLWLTGWWASSVTLFLERKRQSVFCCCRTYASLLCALFNGQSDPDALQQVLGYFSETPALQASDDRVFANKTANVNISNW